MKFTQTTLLACFLALLCITSCTPEEQLPQPAPTIQELAEQQTNSPGETPEGAASCCSVSGSSQLMAYWQPDIDDVLSCCHTESINSDFPNCDPWPWGNSTTNTKQITLGLQYPAAINYSAGQINNLINVYAGYADDYRPGPNWYIHDIQFVPYLGCPSGYKCFRLRFKYKKMLCSQTGINNPRRN